MVIEVSKGGEASARVEEDNESGVCPAHSFSFRSDTSIRSLLLYVGLSLFREYPYSPNARNGTKGTSHVQRYHTNDPATRSTRAHCHVPGVVAGYGYSRGGTPRGRDACCITT